ADYEAIRVNAEAGEHQTEAYRKIHPYGRIPALVLPDGQPVFESAGMTMHIVDQFPHSDLAPPPGTPQRAHYYQWMM
ncbi:MAG: glutathione S-transferase, partial [Candidatus Latescibacteria bacterium]|nr:glutathione S-transferase [Candidatus Latescibacterota bacterium]NIO78920.1 glutathione S-transferase [Candidatus Latescibacterota bacterium]